MDISAKADYNKVAFVRSVQIRSGVMTSLVLEQSTIDKLKTVEDRIEVRDHQGKLIGFFHPAITQADVEQYECPISEEELLRRSRDCGGRPLPGILDDLRKPS